MHPILSIDFIAIKIGRASLGATSGAARDLPVGGRGLETPWASEVTSLTLRRPRRVSLRRNSVQIGSASEVPISKPSPRGPDSPASASSARASKMNPCSRFYAPEDFDVVAGCHHAITERREFRFVRPGSSRPARAAQARSATRARSTTDGLGLRLSKRPTPRYLGPAMTQLSAISLFTGAGGLDLGFEAAGFETRATVEMDVRCIETLRANRPWPVIARDVSHVPTAELLERAGLAAGEPEVLIGGPPCQPFSKAGFWATGQARRLEDPRATTLDHYLRILEEARPRTFLLENVEGLGFRGKDEGLAFIREAVAAINARVGTAYAPTVRVLNAADFGVPQLRRRLFVVGARDGTPFEFPEPTHAGPTSPDLRAGCAPWRTAWDALHDLAEPNDRNLAPKGKWAGLLPSIPEGQNYLWHTDRSGGEPLFGWRRRFWSFLLKLAKDQPAWTLAAQPGPATGPFHWTGRRLSMREMARLQTFPDDVTVTGSIADAQRQLGNAVPPLLAEVLARAIRLQLLGRPARNKGPQLAIRAAPTPPPPPAPPEPVAEHYLALRGEHASHPGTGKGYAAAKRAERDGSGNLLVAE